MQGNVWQWVSGCYTGNYSGGSWASGPVFLRSAYRTSDYVLGARTNSIGLRLARTGDR